MNNQYNIMLSQQNAIERIVTITNNMLEAYCNDEWEVVTELYNERHPLLQQICSAQSKIYPAQDLITMLDFIYKSDLKIMNSCQQALQHCADQLCRLNISKKMINAYKEYDGHN